MAFWIILYQILCLQSFSMGAILNHFTSIVYIAARLALSLRESGALRQFAIGKPPRDIAPYKWRLKVVGATIIEA